MIGDSPPSRPQSGRLRKGLAILVIASGLTLAVFTSLTWGPMHENEWPGFVPFAMALGSALLVWFGAGLWTGTWTGRWPEGPDA